MSDGSFSLSTAADVLLALDMAGTLAESKEPRCRAYTYPAVYAWWFILVLCILPVHRRFQQIPEEGAETAAPAKPST
jgi:hypothetical protein